MRGLPIKCHRYAIKTTGAVVDEPSTLMFKKLKKAIKSRIVTAENAKRMAALPEEDTLNVYFIQELRQ